MKKNSEKVFVGLEKLEKREGRPRTAITKRLDSGRAIQIRFHTKAQLLTIISRKEGLESLNHSLIIEGGHSIQIVLIADPFAPHVLMYVSTVENP